MQKHPQAMLCIIIHCIVIRNRLHAEQKPGVRLISALVQCVLGYV